MEQEITFRINDLRNMLIQAENEYLHALHQDKEFAILKELRMQIKEFKRKILLYTEVWERHAF